MRRATDPDTFLHLHRLLRRERAEYYAGFDPATAPRQTRALLTMVRDEAIFLPLFLRYYSQFFAPEDIYVLDHASTDGSTDGPGFQRIPVDHPYHDNVWMNSVIEDAQHELLERYDVVVHADADEIIVPDPDWGSLDDYLLRFDEEWVSCVGRELLHQPVSEPPLDLSRPVLHQRDTWFANPLYDKPLIAKVPMRWGPGRHRPADGPMNLDPDLYLLHLHRMDIGLCRQRKKRFAVLPPSEVDRAAGYGAHAEIDESRFAAWFHHDAGFPGFEVVPEEIPRRFRDVI